jgi:hypothetical protein
MPEVPFTPLFLGVKLIDIGLVTIYFFSIGIVVAKVFDIAYGEFKESDYHKKSLIRIFFEICLHLFLLGVVAYALRNIIELIPFPLEGVGGFQHRRLKELEGGHALAVVIFLFQKNLRDKVIYFARRAFGINAGGEEI